MSIDIEKIRNSILRRPGQGEEITDSLQGLRIPIAQIKEEQGFVNVRQEIDREKIDQLKQDISDNGLKVPIVVRATSKTVDHESIFFIRAGFRRITAVKELGWDHILAIVIPADAPDIDDYWINLSENCQRESVTPYEIACQTRFLVARQKASYEEISSRTNVPENRLRLWVKFIQNIPDEILNAWKNRHPILTDRKLNEYLLLAPWNALQKWQVDLGKMPKDPFMLLARRRKSHRIKPATFEVMQLLHGAIGVAPNVNDDARRLALACVEICMGSQQKIPGIWPRRSNIKIAGQKYWPEQLDLPDQDLGDEVQEPTENGLLARRIVDEDEERVQSRTSKEKIRAEARVSRTVKR